MAAQTIDIMAQIGLARCRQIINDEFNRASTVRHGVNGVIDPRGCWKSTRSLNNDGYSRISIRPTAELNRFNQGLPPLHGNGYQTFYLHKIAYVVQFGQNPPPDEQCSHRCDESNCFNPGHLCSETGEANKDRRFCWGILHCPWHGSEVIRRCTHSPTCMKKPLTKDDFVCCLQEAPSSDAPTSYQVQADSLADDLGSDDHSQLPSNSLQQGTVEDTAEDPRSSTFPSTIPETSQGLGSAISPSDQVYPSSPPILPRRRPREDDNSDDQPPPRRVRTNAPSSTSEARQPTQESGSAYSPPSRESESPTSSERR